MYYIDGPGATPDNKFTDGDPAAGVAPTTVTDDFMNDIQMEILNVLAAAGIAPAKNTQDQLLQALRGLGGTGIFTTAPQFDNTKKGATTEFVQRALGSYSGFVQYAVNTGLTPAAVGKFISLAATITVNMPFASQCPPGSLITFYGSAPNCVINPQAGETLVAIGSGGGNINPFTLPGLATAVFRSTGTGWVLDGGDAALQYSPIYTGPFGTTAPQFDNTKKTATTAFVQRALGSKASVGGYSVNTSLTAVDMGKLHLMTATGTLTFNLPPANSVPAGASFEVMGFGTGTSVFVPVGVDALVCGSPIANISMKSGDALEFTSNGAASWYVRGIGTLKFATGFAANLAVNGYAKLPSGLIFQWGQASSANIAVTFPLVFPTSILGVHAQIQSAGNGNYNANAAFYSTTGFTIYPSSAGIGTTTAYNWFAIGQ
ncbi:gp53-like domain-containing protein [Pseudomonas fluorescens]|uniref:Putative tail fiber protein gp53-like C-terminal domain-containing protein n=1 Tax=Pseudomonas fluorescens TaxID=294 RepID=A0A5E7Q5G0_PSEFL|nr:hypothetical protein [Pseudomonas fluorescens]VVP57064.1 hypothetical protein PS880_05778 [Pseudomonas fluorescens]